MQRFIKGVFFLILSLRSVGYADSTEFGDGIGYYCSGCGQFQGEDISTIENANFLYWLVDVGFLYQMIAEKSPYRDEKAILNRLNRYAVPVTRDLKLYSYGLDWSRPVPVAPPYMLGMRFCIVHGDLGGVEFGIPHFIPVEDNQQEHAYLIRPSRSSAIEKRLEEYHRGDFLIFSTGKALEGQPQCGKDAFVFKLQ